MKFRIPFSSSDILRLKKISEPYSKKMKYKPNSKLSLYLDSSETGLKRKEYIGICRRNFLNNFFVMLFVLFFVLIFINAEGYFFFALGFAFFVSLIVFAFQLAYPRVYFLKRQRDIERNLLSALEDIQIQLSSGIPLFSILVNISDSNYGELSVEFKKSVKRINAGESEVDVLESIGEKNPSAHFRRALWQISNGMRSGSDMMIVIKENIKSLNEEQLIQIQEYGNKLNPLIMFFMLVSVIAPALSVTFLTILSSMISLPGNTTKLIFIGLLIFVMLIQIMFLGVIKSKRPSLL